MADSYETVFNFIKELTFGEVVPIAKAIKANEQDVKSLLLSIFAPKTKRCLSNCPKCGAVVEDIKWLLGEFGEMPKQDATCNKCGHEFVECYIYAHTEEYK